MPQNPAPEGPWEFMGKPMDLPYDNPLSNGKLPDAQAFKDWDKRTCGCPMPMALKKRHRALGRGSGIRLCCVARALESYMELPAGTLYFWMEFEPTWEWDSAAMVKNGDAEDNEDIQWIERGEPPDWMKQRMEEKDIPTTKARR